MGRSIFRTSKNWNGRSLPPAVLPLPPGQARTKLSGRRVVSGARPVIALGDTHAPRRAADLDCGVSLAAFAEQRSEPPGRRAAAALRGDGGMARINLGLRLPPAVQAAMDRRSRAPVRDLIIPVRLDGRSTLATLTGNGWLSAALGRLREGRLWVRAGSRYGFADSDGHLAISARVHPGAVLRGRVRHREGPIVQCGNCVGVIDTQGNFLLQPTWERITVSCDPRIYEVRSGKSRGIVDDAGRWLFGTSTRYAGFDACERGLVNAQGQDPAPLDFTFTVLDDDSQRIHDWMSLPQAGEGWTAAVCEQISMCVDRAVRRSTSWPDHALARIAALYTAHRDRPRPPEIGHVIGNSPALKRSRASASAARVQAQ
jgi:hypothetical protein